MPGYPESYKMLHVLRNVVVITYHEALDLLKENDKWGVRERLLILLMSSLYYLRILHGGVKSP